MSKHSAPFPVLFLHCREMDDADGWDLHAVVRSCAASSTTTTDGGALPSTSTPALPWFENPTDKRRSEDFKDFRLPLVSNWSDPPQILPFSEHNCLIFQQISKELLQQTPTGSTSKTSVKRYKKRKSVMKKQIYRVDAEKLSSDVWSWRKYGQKPIKGSPFPRSYYRCSSSKLCTARKQVERDKSNPEIFLVTYTAEHNHPAPSNRKSLTGVTRQKPTTEMEKTEKQFVDGDNTDNCDFRFSHMALDDFFGGMESVIRGEGERCSWDSEPTFPVNSGGSGAISGGN